MKDITVSDIQVLWDKNQIDNEVSRIAKAIDNRVKNYDSVNLIPILSGSVMFVSDLMSQLENLRPGFYKMFPLIVKSYGNELESQGTKIYGDEFLKDSLDLDSPTIVVDDIMDTGETLLEVSQSVAKISDQEILTAVLLNKHGKRKHVIEPDYYCFSLDDKSWVVGYGMDYKGKFRGLNYVGTIFN